MRQITCKKCGHVWVPRVKKPKECVACKQYFPEKARNGSRKK